MSCTKQMCLPSIPVGKIVNEFLFVIVIDYGNAFAIHTMAVPVRAMTTGTFTLFFVIFHFFLIIMCYLSVKCILLTVAPMAMAMRYPKRHPRVLWITSSVSQSPLWVANCDISTMVDRIAPVITVLLVE